MKKDIDEKQNNEYNEFHETPPDYVSEDGGKFWFGKGCPKIKSYIFENEKEDTEKEINNG
jgi:hypothetical protein